MYIIRKKAEHNEVPPNSLKVTMDLMEIDEEEDESVHGYERKRSFKNRRLSKMVNRFQNNLYKRNSKNAKGPMEIHLGNLSKDTNDDEVH